MKLEQTTCSIKKIQAAFDKLYIGKVKIGYGIRQLGIALTDLTYEPDMQLSFFDDPMDDEKEKQVEIAMVGIRNRYGKNALLKGFNLFDKATGIQWLEVIMGNTNNVQRHADRAMQFAPFAALKGYYESIRMQERITEPRKELSEDEAEALSSTLNKLKVGTTIKIRYYDIDAYTNIEGVLTEINPPYRRLKVVKTAIPFDDIYTIELLGKDILF